MSEASTGRKPWVKWYPADWRGDLNLRECSIAARGLWVELCGLMHECVPYGHLTAPDGTAKRDEKAAEQCGVAVALYRKLLAELERNGVCSRTAAGVLFSRRMVRDSAKAQQDSVNGRHGGNPNLGPKGVNRGVNPPVNPSVNREDKATVKGEDKAQRLEARKLETTKAGTPPTPPCRVAASRTPLPAWLPPDAWQRWARHRGSKLTPAAVTLQIRKLEALRGNGFDPEVCIDLAIESGWATFYPPRASPTGNGTNGTARHTERHRVASEIFGGGTDHENDHDERTERTIDGEATRIA